MEKTMEHEMEPGKLYLRFGAFTTRLCYTRGFRKIRGPQGP